MLRILTSIRSVEVFGKDCRGEFSYRYFSASIAEKEAAAALQGAKSTCGEKGQNSIVVPKAQVLQLPTRRYEQRITELWGTFSVLVFPLKYNYKVADVSYHFGA